MFPEPIKRALEAAGVSESSLDRIRLAQGFVGKASAVAGAAFLVLLMVAFSLRDTNALLLVAGITLLLFAIFFLGSLWFAHTHPDLALLEGAELVRWRTIDMAAKGISIDHTAPPQPIGKAEGEKT
ncbi:hypothetical protein [Rhodopseudomonas sp. RCAM05734]|uniref:hypothetical protein n=1 Tax=Rhodopseudomonas sp. RCAM05734 TaxID=3457549 RepID=UPI004043DF1E